MSSCDGIGYEMTAEIIRRGRCGSEQGNEFAVNFTRRRVKKKHNIAQPFLFETIIINLTVKRFRNGKKYNENSSNPLRKPFSHFLIGSSLKYIVNHLSGTLFIQLTN